MRAVRRDCVGLVIGEGWWDGVEKGIDYMI